MIDWRRKLGVLVATPPWAALTPTPEQAAADGAALAARLGVAVPAEAALASAVAFGPDGVLRDLAGGWPASPGTVAVYHAMADAHEHVPVPPDTIERLRASVGGLLDAVRKAHLTSSDFGAERRAYLAVWRLMPEAIAAGLGNAGRLWERLPADLRLPGHTYWPHQALMSALAGTWNGTQFRPALLVFTIASAQRHVASSRRTQDFWMGSYLLSCLMWAGMRAVAERYGPDAVLSPRLLGQPLVDLWLAREGVFPAGTDLERLARVAGLVGMGARSRDQDERALLHATFTNVFSVAVPEDDVNPVADGIRQAITDEFKRIACAVRRYVERAAADQAVRAAASARTEEPALLESVLGGLADDPVWNAVWARQLDDALAPDLYWAAVPWPTDPAGFGRWIEEARQFLGDDAVAPVEALAAAGTGSPSGLLYSLASQLAGRLLAARKNTRTFAQYAEPGEKSSLSGTHQALATSYDNGRQPRLRETWTALSRLETSDSGQRYKLVGRIRRGDRLSASDLTRRLALEAFFAEALALAPDPTALPAERRVDHHLFPSTSSMAVAAFKHRCVEAVLGVIEIPERERVELHRALMRYAEYVVAFLQPRASRYDLYYGAAALPKTVALLERLPEDERKPFQNFLRLDGDWLYEESYDLRRIGREYGVPVEALDRRAWDAALDALHGLLRAAGSARLGGPGRYYAIVAADGDEMGRWISRGARERLPDLRAGLHPAVAGAAPGGSRAVTPADHQTLNGALHHFSLTVVPDVVERAYLGRVVYAGGDDLLALMATEDALAAAQALAEFFQRTEWTPPGGRPLLLPGPRASLSAGIALVHHSHPLSLAIQEANSAVEYAKHVLERGACAFRLLKRSGEPLTTGVQWRRDGAPAFAMLQRIVAGFTADGGVSPRLIRQLEEEARAFERIPEDKRSKVMHLELCRLLGRHVRSRDAANAIRELQSVLPLSVGQPHQPRWAHLAGLLKVAQFVAEAP